jgi:hypothetical protein
MAKDWSPPTDRDRLEEYRQSLVDHHYERAGCVNGAWFMTRYRRVGSTNQLNAPFDLVCLTVEDYEGDR